MSGPADFKSTPGFENQPRFLGVIEQNKIRNSFDKYCTLISIVNSELCTLLQLL